MTPEPRTYTLHVGIECWPEGSAIVSVSVRDLPYDELLRALHRASQYASEAAGDHEDRQRAAESAA